MVGGEDAECRWVAGGYVLEDVQGVVHGEIKVTVGQVDGFVVEFEGVELLGVFFGEEV